MSIIMNRNSLLGLTFIVPIMFLPACSQDQEAIEPSAEASVAQGYQPQVSGVLATLAQDDDPDSKTFQTLDGRGFDIELFAGEKVFVNFWATWCAPCIREIPSINRAAQALEAEGYTFIFASDEDTDTINDFLYEREFPGNFVKLNGYFATYGIGAVPSSWLVDQNGDVATVWAGAFEWDSEEMLEEIRNPTPSEL
jgi:thiol-disulfide isomerase/thioredoxin